jgi:hypothetical protein
LLYLSVGVVAFLVRLTPLLLGGGLRGYGRYDDGVYYAAADALTFGRVPYRDFVLLHPPGLPLLLAPFALLGRVTSDPTGLVAGRVVFMLVGAVNAMLVVAVTRRWTGWRPALLAGLLYACWSPAVYAEQATLLEPLGSTALLVALLRLPEPTPRRPRSSLVAGAALGAAVTLKIWYVVPWLLAIGWEAARQRGRSAVMVAGAGAAVLLVVLVPFLALARGRMWDMVVRDQLLRPAALPASRLGRLTSITGARQTLPLHGAPLGAVTLAVLLLVAGACVGCLLRATSRLPLLLLLGDAAVLMASPVYFRHYAHLIAAPAAVVLGIGLPVVVARLRGRSRLVLQAAAAALILLSGAAVASSHQGRPMDGAALARSAPPGCVAGDSPELLIGMNRLSSDLRNGCTVPVDVSGITYDTLHRTRRNGRVLARRANAPYQRFLVHYLMSASSYGLLRGPQELSVRTRRLLEHQPVLARSGAVVLRRGGQP